MKRSMICLLLLVAAWVLPALAAEDLRSLPVEPALHWDPEDQVLAAGYPLQVVAWMHGEIDDPDGVLASMKDRLDEQMESPGFAWALSELQGILRSRIGDRPVSAFEVDTVLIPGILAGRRDIAQGLRGGPRPMGAIGDGDCFQIHYGTWECLFWVPGWFGSKDCGAKTCVGGGGSDCTYLEKVRCPDEEESDSRLTVQP